MNKKTYLLTGGIVPLLRNRHGLIISQEGETKIEQIEGDYASELGKVLNGFIDPFGGFEWEVKFIPRRDVENSLRRIVRENRTQRPLISLDDVYCTSLADGCYSVTRTVDPDNLAAGTKLGPRPRNIPLEEQASCIAKRFGNEIDITDIGTFSGETITGEITQRFQKEGIKIKGAYLVFAGKTGIKNLQEAGLNPSFAYSIDWIDWLEIRDCIGFDGRKVSGNHLDSDVANTFVKYTTNSEDWASIPACFGKQFEFLYEDTFGKISRCLEKEGLKASLTPSEQNPLVYELKFSEGE